MSCPIEIERRVLCAAENAATASLTEEGLRKNYLFGQRNMRMSFHYKCTNLHLDRADYIHLSLTLFLSSLCFFSTTTTTTISYLIIVIKIPLSAGNAVREREKQFPIQNVISHCLCIFLWLVISLNALTVFQGFCTVTVAAHLYRWAPWSSE